MELRDIREVREIVGHDGVNDYLDAGWVLLNTGTDRDGDRCWIEYSLGWPRDLPAVHPGR
jgi:hypothetical protein